MGKAKSDPLRVVRFVRDALAQCLAARPWEDAAAKERSHAELREKLATLTADDIEQLDFQLRDAEAKGVVPFEGTREFIADALADAERWARRHVNLADWSRIVAVLAGSEATAAPPGPGEIRVTVGVTRKAPMIHPVWVEALTNSDVLHRVVARLDAVLAAYNAALSAEPASPTAGAPAAAPSRSRATVEPADDRRSVRISAPGLSTITLQGADRVWLFLKVHSAAGQALTWAEILKHKQVTQGEAADRAERTTRGSRDVRGRSRRWTTDVASLRRAGGHIRSQLGDFANRWRHEGEGEGATVCWLE